MVRSMAVSMSQSILAGFWNTEVEVLVATSPKCIQTTTECEIAGLTADTLYRFYVQSEVGSVKSQKSIHGLVSTLRDQEATKLPLASFLYARFMDATARLTGPSGPMSTLSLNKGANLISSANQAKTEGLIFVKLDR